MMQAVQMAELLLLCQFFVGVLQGIAVEESSTGAIVSFPELLDGDLFNVTWEVEPAAFGYADYGGTLEAFLVLPMNKSYHTECNLEPDSLNPYIELINDYQGSDAKWILLIDRGDCYFANKVYNAQQLGAHGAILFDNKEEAFLVMWEPDDFEHDINIPSVELQYDHAMTLMKHLNVKNWDPNDMSNAVYPDAIVNENSDSSFIITKALIEWGLPHDDDRVEWELWTSANDDRTMEFKHNFKWTGIYLDANNYTVFTPHYYILNGSHWNCDTDSLKCGTQCSNSGRYCAVDPEYDLNNGIDGMDVVQENLRQLCIWNFTLNGDASIHNESVWWDYSNLWNDNCFNNTYNENTFNSECSYAQMATLEEKGHIGLSSYVSKCINESGGYGYYDGINTFLEYEVRFRESESIHVLPTFRVNEFMIYGEVDCDVITEDECSVLDSICSGFIDGTKPDICFCPFDDRDCSGVCYGNKTYDRCGNCLSVDSNQWNNCVGCDNVTNSGYSINTCGYCINGSNDDFDTYGKGCDGTCNSMYYYDDCDVCRSIYSIKWNNCVGCDNVAHSGKIINPCGFCILNTTENFDTYGMDCNNTCNGNKMLDKCNQCLDMNDDGWNECENTNPTTTETTKTTETFNMTAINATEVNKATETFESTETTKITMTIATTYTAESTGSTEVTKATETTKITATIASTETATSTEATKATEVSETPETSTIESIESTTESTKGAHSTESTESAENTESTKVTEATVATYASTTEATEATQVTETTQVAELETTENTSTKETRETTNANEIVTTLSTKTMGNTNPNNKASSSSESSTTLMWILIVSAIVVFFTIVIVIGCVMIIKMRRKQKIVERQVESILSNKPYIQMDSNLKHKRIAVPTHDTADNANDDDIENEGDQEEARTALV